MFRNQVLILVLSAFLFFSHTQLQARVPASSATEVYMSPHQGRESFDRIYEIIRGANKYVHITLYSWSDAGLFKALKDTLEKEKAPKVRIVLHRPLYPRKGSVKMVKPTLKKRVDQLEKLGAEFKLAKQKMHEKFLIADDKILMNGSANMSSGPLTRYSENTIFYKAQKRKTHFNNKLIEQFKHEFSILFNSGTDLITHGEGLAAEVKDYSQFNKDGVPSNKTNPETQLFLVSSSMNFNFKRNKPTSKLFKQGRYLSLIVKKQDSVKTRRVEELLIREINKAQDNILVCLNHLTLPKIKDALMNAVKRGVKINWLADNNEYKTDLRSKEQTPNFVAEYKKYKKTKEAPVRVKWYSISPSPRYAFLNHHKFILIDHGTRKPILLSGSSNMSKTAEFKQFDNVVIHRGEKFNRLNQAFADEFWSLWSLNRTANDKPSQKLLKRFKSPREGYMAIHKKTPISLTWNEVRSLEEAINDAAPGLSQKLVGFEHCGFYHSKKGQFFNYNSGKKSFRKCLGRKRR